ncbi:MAG: alanine racemase [Phycisphaerales bacterium]
MATSRLEVNLSAIDRNYGIIRGLLESPATAATADQPAPPAARPARPAVCGVIKQNAYGLGSARMARKLSALGCELLAVYCLDEARELAEVPITTPILCLMPVRGIDRGDPVYRLTSRGRLHLTLHDAAQTQELIAAAVRLGVQIPVHVQLDTGMSRGGCLEDEARKVVELVLGSPRLQLAGLMTHFSSPAGDDTYTREQAKAFKTWIESVKGPIAAARATSAWVHAANTAGVLRSRALHASMVRVGQGFYGYGFESFTDPLAVEFGAAGKALQPAVRWLSRIVHIHEIPKGAPVGYGRTYKAPRPTRVGLVPVGYADGYPTSLSSNPQSNQATARVQLTGHMYDRPRTQGGPASAPETRERPSWAGVIGRVSMDQITIDLTGLPESLARVGAEVELIGSDPQGPNGLPMLARAANSITHELLCRVCPKIERVYVSSAGSESGAAGGAAPADSFRAVTRPSMLVA